MRGPGQGHPRRDGVLDQPRQRDRRVEGELVVAPQRLPFGARRPARRRETEDGQPELDLRAAARRGDELAGLPAPPRDVLRRLRPQELEQPVRVGARRRGGACGPDARPRVGAGAIHQRDERGVQLADESCASCPGQAWRPITPSSAPGSHLRPARSRRPGAGGSGPAVAEALLGQMGDDVGVDRRFAVARESPERHRGQASWEPPKDALSGRCRS